MFVRASAEETVVEKICRLAKAGDKQTLTEMVERGISLETPDNRGRSAVVLLAHGGYKEAVGFLLNEFPRTDYSISDAIYGYALGGHVDEVNPLIVKSDICEEKGLMRFEPGVAVMIQDATYKQKALHGYEFGGHLSGTEASIVHLMSLTKDVKFRASLAKSAKERNQNLDVNSLMREAQEPAVMAAAARALAFKNYYIDKLHSLEMKEWDGKISGRFTLFECAVLASAECERGLTHKIRSGHSVSQYVLPETAPIELKAFVLCLSGSILQVDIDKLKTEKEKLFEAIKKLPDEIAEKGLLAINDPASPVGKVMYAPRVFLPSSDTSNMPTQFREEIEKRELLKSQIQTRNDV